MIRLDRALGLAAAIAAVVGIAWLSTVRTRPNESADAVLRLTWSARPERVEDCRPQSEEALAKLPPHMRQALICEGTTATYQLEVRRDGTVIDQQIVRGGGMRHDRPLYVSRDIPVPAGDAAISVRLTRLGATTSAGVSGDERHERDESGKGSLMTDDRRRRESEERRWERGEELPASLSIERRLHFVSREVILVTYDPERRELLAVEGTTR
jgi:hypothetical protein